MQKILETLKFFGWPVICGLFAAVLFLQNQQLQHAADQLAAISLERADPSPPEFAEVIARAAPSVVSISATSVNVESVERAADDQLNLYLGERASLGSGIIVSEQGFILTNLHVVDTLFDALIAMCAGVAKPIPSKLPDSEKIDVLIPTSLPSLSMRAPPEFPGFIAASVWMNP